MRIMTRILNHDQLIDVLGDNNFVRGIHSVGLPRPVNSIFLMHMFNILNFINNCNKYLRL